MTSIVCWKNRESGQENLWAASDSRITDGRGIRMMDNCAKLFTIPIIVYQDRLQTQPIKLTSIGVGFSGSTILGHNIKETLANILGYLTPVNYYDAPDYPLENRMPKFEEIAAAARKIVSHFVLSYGQYTLTVPIEVVVFGYCLQAKKPRIFRLFNKSVKPNEILLEEADELLICGDETTQVSKIIEDIRRRNSVDTLDWQRAPLKALASVVQDGGLHTIGGYYQLVLCTHLGAKIFTISGDGSVPTLVGFDLVREIGSLGGFIPAYSFGFSLDAIQK